MISASAYIHPRAFVDEGAVVAADVIIGAGTVVRSGVAIGDGCAIQEHCLIGLPGVTGETDLSIPSGSVIRSHSIIYSGSRFGEGLETGHHVVIREKTVAGKNLRVGNYCDIEGDCEIGDFCRLHGYVHVGKGTRMGHFVWLFSLSTMTNDPLPPSLLNIPVTLGDGAVVCVGAIVMPGTVIGKGAFVCAGTIARGDIPAGAVVSGTEGKVINHVSHLIDIAGGVRHPWMRHYRKGYPFEAIDRLAVLEKEIMENRFTIKLG